MTIISIWSSADLLSRNAKAAAGRPGIIPPQGNALFRPVALRPVPRDGREMSRHSRRRRWLYLNPMVLCVRLHHISPASPSLPIKIANLPDVQSRSAGDKRLAARPRSCIVTAIRRPVINSRWRRLQICCATLERRGPHPVDSSALLFEHVHCAFTSPILDFPLHRCDKMMTASAILSGPSEFLPSRLLQLKSVQIN